MSAKVIIYGGAGALGRSLVQHFKGKNYVSYFTPAKPSRYKLNAMIYRP